MRFADHPTTEVSLRIHATPQDIWSRCTDLPVPTSTELEEAHWDPEGPALGLGARTLGRNRRGARPWRTISAVVEREHHHGPGPA